jgi:hypothetical protein
MPKSEFLDLTIAELGAIRKAIADDDSRVDLERGQLRADLFNLHRDTKKKPNPFTADECRMYQSGTTEEDEAREMDAFVRARLADMPTESRESGDTAPSMDG